MEVPRGMEPTGTNGRTRHTLSDPCGSGLVLWWFSRWMARNAVSCGHDDDTGKAFIVRVRCPVPGPPRPESVVWLVPLPADPGWGLAVHSGFAVVMAQVRRPVPFRTRKLRPGTAMVLHSRGCGRVARRRIHMLGVPVELRLREPPFLFFFRIFPGLHGPPGNAFQARRRCFSVACGRLPFHNTPRITWSVSVTVINDVMRFTRYVRAGSRESRYDGKRQKPDD